MSIRKMGLLLMGLRHGDGARNSKAYFVISLYLNRIASVSN